MKNQIKIKCIFNGIVVINAIHLGVPMLIAGNQLTLAQN